MFLESLTSVLLSIVVAASGYAVGMAAEYFKAKAKEAKTAIKSEEAIAAESLFDSAITAVDTIALAVVGKLEQTTAKDLRQKIAQGSANKESLTALAESAYNEIINSLSPEAINNLNIFIGNTENYIKSAIESKLLELKGRIYKG